MNKVKEAFEHMSCYGIGQLGGTAFDTKFKKSENE